MTQREIDLIKRGRHLARTDLYWLAKYVLGMDKINEAVHRPLINSLQKFTVQGEDHFDPETGVWDYRPVNSDPLLDYPDDDKRRLILAPRGWYKTSVNVIAHSIQWILNYPDITILLVHASQEIAEDILRNIKYQFQANNVMRYYFPEFCPPPDKDWGTQGKFNIPTRKSFVSTATTMEVSGIETVRTGKHYHIIKYTDLVDDKNSATKELAEKIIHRYGMSRNLLISAKYWLDIEGTRYTFSDLYGRIVDTWLENDKADKKQEFICFTMGCYKTDLDGEEEHYSPDELTAPFLKDEKGQYISRFPEEFPTELLEQMRTDTITGGDMFSSQQLNNPVALSSEVFSEKDMKWKTPEELKRIPPIFHITTVDFAHTKGRRSDYTAITTTMVDRINRRYVVDIQHGKWSADESIDQLFKVLLKYKPAIVKVEKSAFWSGLLPSVRRKAQQLNYFPNIRELQRPSNISKEDRIEASLQPWNKQGLLYFSTGINKEVKQHLIHEWTRFPKFRHNDIMDTLADQFDDETIMTGNFRVRKEIQQLMAEAEAIKLRNLDQYDKIFNYDNPADRELPTWAGLGKI